MRGILYLINLDILLVNFKVLLYNCMIEKVV